LQSPVFYRVLVTHIAGRDSEAATPGAKGANK